MRKVVVSEFLSLDGVMEDPGGAEKSAHGGWTMPYWDDEIGKFKFDELFASDALLLGRVTYQGFAAAWPSMTDEQGFADRMNSLPIDEYQLMVYPIVLGGGKRLFTDGRTTTLRLVNTKTFRSGVVLLAYQTAPHE